MQRKENFIEGNFYHIYNRGVDKRVVFTDTSDYKRFMALLRLSNADKRRRTSNILRSLPIENLVVDRGKSLVGIGAFCLMPNHFHLLVTPYSEHGITKYMLKLQTAYSMYFNIKNDRSGSLFEGPFKSKYAEGDRYLRYLFSYIHLNPAKLKDNNWKDSMYSRDDLIRFVENYPYSSFREYLSGAHAITDPSAFPYYFSSQVEVKTHVVDWLSDS